LFNYQKKICTFYYKINTYNKIFLILVCYFFIEIITYKFFFKKKKNYYLRPIKNIKMTQKLTQLFSLSKSKIFIKNETKVIRLGFSSILEKEKKFENIIGRKINKKYWIS